MKSNRMRVAIPADQSVARLESRWVEGSGAEEFGRIDLMRMSPPAVIPKIHPEQVVQDILISTLSKLQEKASPEVSRAAARYLAHIRAGLL